MVYWNWNSFIFIRPAFASFVNVWIQKIAMFMIEPRWSSRHCMMQNFSRNDAAGATGSNEIAWGKDVPK